MKAIGLGILLVCLQAQIPGAVPTVKYFQSGTNAHFFCSQENSAVINIEWSLNETRTNGETLNTSTYFDNTTGRSYFSILDVSKELNSTCVVCTIEFSNGHTMPYDFEMIVEDLPQVSNISITREDGNISLSWDGPVTAAPEVTYCVDVFRSNFTTCSSDTHISIDESECPRICNCRFTLRVHSIVGKGSHNVSLFEKAALLNDTLSVDSNSTRTRVSFQVSTLVCSGTVRLGRRNIPLHVTIHDSTSTVEVAIKTSAWLNQSHHLFSLSNSAGRTTINIPIRTLIESNPSTEETPEESHSVGSGGPCTSSLSGLAVLMVVMAGTTS